LPTVQLLQQLVTVDADQAGAREVGVIVGVADDEIAQPVVPDDLPDPAVAVASRRVTPGGAAVGTQ
jgi:hypothetical protein